MRLMWFHLMPYTELPADFRDKHPSVWVDIHSSLFDPKRAHHMYNDFMDELEYAADCGFDAVCVNEHHSNGYGLMPSPNLIASSLARRTTDTAICVMGNSLALYNPPTRVAEEFAMIDCISGGRLIAGFPVGTPMDTCYAYGQNPQPAARPLPRGARPGPARLDRPRHLRVQRPLQPAALRQHLAASGAAAASADLGARRRLGRNVAVVRRDGLRLLLPVSYYGYKIGRATMDGFWNEMASAWARTAIPTAPASCSSSASAKPASTPWTSTARPPNTSTATACTSIRASPRLPATPPKPPSAWDCKARSSKAASYSDKFNKLAREMDAIVDNGYVIIGSPDEVVEQLREVAVNLNVGNLMLLLQFGNMSKDLTRYNTRLFAEQVMPKLKALFANGSTAGGRSRWRRPSAPRFPPTRRACAAE